MHHHTWPRISLCVLDDTWGNTTQISPRLKNRVSHWVIYMMGWAERTKELRITSLKKKKTVTDCVYVQLPLESRREKWTPGVGVLGGWELNWIHRKRKTALFKQITSFKKEFWPGVVCACVSVCVMSCSVFFDHSPPYKLRQCLLLNPDLLLLTVWLPRQSLTPVHEC